MSKKAPFGTWISPITAEGITKSANRITDIVVDRVTSEVYHLESRPSEGGRSVLVHTASDRDIVGANWNVRTSVQEYGGFPAVAHAGVAYFSHLGDGRLYVQTIDGVEKDPQPVTPEGKPYRYACLDPVPGHPQLLIAVLEDHTIDEAAQVKTTVVVVHTQDKSVTLLLSGADFYALPKFSPDGKRLVWIQWSYPDMPWEGSEIHVADVHVADGGQVTLTNRRHVAGERGRISAAYPSWATNERLIFTSDESGFVNPWKYEDGKAAPLFPEHVAEDFGHCYWILNFFPYAVLDSEGEAGVFSAVKKGRDVLYLVDLRGGTKPELVTNTPYVCIDAVRALPSSHRQFIFIGQKTNELASIVQGRVDSSSRVEFTTLKAPKSLVINGSPLSTDIISEPHPLTLSLSDNRPLHVVYYPPHNTGYSGSDIPHEKPPCVVNLHGGPTLLEAQGLTWEKQYFTSRGWGWLDINYRGSSGFGRKYIEHLRSNWGVVDVEDTTIAPTILSNESYNLIDPKRLVVRGSSSGGYTVLASISLGSDLNLFAAATSLYGISDLCKLADFSHKFESGYVDHLLGGNIKSHRQTYESRSPINHADKIEVPLLVSSNGSAPISGSFKVFQILQGEIDKVVPKEQAEIIYNSIKKKGRTVEYKLYAGEGHGWRQESNMRDALERELAFYERILGLNT